MTHFRDVWEKSYFSAGLFRAESRIKYQCEDQDFR